MRSGLGWVGDLQPPTPRGERLVMRELAGGGPNPLPLHLSASLFLHDSAQTHQIVLRLDQ